MAVTKLAPRHVSRPWLYASAAVMGLTAVLVKGFMRIFNDVHSPGLAQFLDLLERRASGGRQRGLITVSNHISVMDDPLVWCVLPLRTAASPSRMRWSLGAHDICFRNRFVSTFFRLGQVLPTHRLQHSPAGGLFQPTIAQAIQLLSRPQAFPLRTPEQSAASLADPEDPAAGVGTRTDPDVALGPAAFTENRLPWLHVFPEGRVVQNPPETTGYFKWGVSRLILEADPVPDVVPMFIDGTQRIMPEDRGWPRWAPRFGFPVRITFGSPLDVESEFGALRSRWEELKRREEDGLLPHGLAPGELSHSLRYGDDANKLRIEVAGKVRDHVVALARGRRNASA